MKQIGLGYHDAKGAGERYGTATTSSSLQESQNYPVADLVIPSPGCAAAPSEAEKRIEAALNSPTQFEFTDLPLKDVVNYLKDLHHIEIQLDTKALNDVGVASDTPINKNVQGISLRSALSILLKEHGLTYVIRDEVLYITSQEDADQTMTTVFYPVTDLVAFRDKSGERWSDFDSLITLIKTTVKPTSWDDTGGTGTISQSIVNQTDMLVVSQTQEVHRELAKVLEEMRRVGGTQPGGPLPLREKPPAMGAACERGGMVGGMGGGMGGMGMGGMMGMGGAAPNGGEDKKPASKPEAVKLETETLPSPEMPPAAAQPPAAANPASDGSLKKHRNPGLAVKQPAEPAAAAKEKLNASPYDAFSREQAKTPSTTTAKSLLPFEGKLVVGKALAGVRSLKINLVSAPAESDRVMTFQSLGVEPQLVVTLTNRSRISALAWGLALLVGLAGVAMTRRPARTKTAFIFTVGLLATLVPLLTASIEVAQVCDTLFYAACLLAPYYLIVGMVRWSAGCCCRVCAWCGRKLARTPAAPAAPTAIVLALLLATAAYADPPAAKPNAGAGPYVIEVVEPPAPVKVPDDAIILPYDPDGTFLKGPEKLLVPYDKYVELWNRAAPGQEDRGQGPALRPTGWPAHPTKRCWKATTICC